MNEASRRGRIAWELVAVVVLVAGLVTAVIVPRFPVSERGTVCLNNVSQLAAEYGLAVAEKRFDPKLHGSAQVLSWIPTLRPGDERLLICPGDQDIAVPETPEEARAYHPADANELRAARGLGSYAVRDFEKFPIDPNATEKQPILCDRQGKGGRTNHHKGCIVIGFVGGEAQKMTNAELGIPDGDPIVVGPDSPCPLLRVFERP